MSSRPAVELSRTSASTFTCATFGQAPFTFTFAAPIAIDPIVCKLFDVYGQSVDADDKVRAQVEDAPLFVLCVHTVDTEASYVFLYNLSTKTTQDVRLPLCISGILALRCGVMLQARQPSSLPWYTWFHPLEEPQPIAMTDELLDQEGRPAQPGANATLLACVDDTVHGAVAFAFEPEQCVLQPYVVTGSRAHGSLAPPLDTVTGTMPSPHGSNQAQDAQREDGEYSSGGTTSGGRTVRFQRVSSRLPDPSSAATRRTDRRVSGGSASSGLGPGAGADLLMAETYHARSYNHGMDGIEEGEDVDEGDEDEGESRGDVDLHSAQPRLKDENEDGVLGQLSGRRGRSGTLSSHQSVVRRFDPAADEQHQHSLQLRTVLLQDAARVSPMQAARRWSRGTGGPTGTLRSPSAVSTGRTPVSSAVTTVPGPSLGDPSASPLDDSLIVPDTEAIHRYSGPTAADTIAEKDRDRVRSSINSSLSASKTRAPAAQLPVRSRADKRGRESAHDEALTVPDWFPADLISAPGAADHADSHKPKAQLAGSGHLSVADAILYGSVGRPADVGQGSVVQGDPLFARRCAAYAAGSSATREGRMGFSGSSMHSSTGGALSTPMQSDLLLLPMGEALQLPIAFAGRVLQVAVARTSATSSRYELYLTGSALDESAPVVCSIQVDVAACVQAVCGGMPALAVLSPPSIVTGVLSALPLPLPLWISSDETRWQPCNDGTLLVNADRTLTWLCHGSTAFSWGGGNVLNATYENAHGLPSCAHWVDGHGDLKIRLFSHSLQQDLCVHAACPWPTPMPLSSAGSAIAAQACALGSIGTILSILKAAERVAAAITDATRADVCVEVGGKRRLLPIRVLSKVRAAALGLLPLPLQLMATEAGVEILVVPGSGSMSAEHIDTALLLLLHLCEEAAGSKPSFTPLPLTPGRVQAGAPPDALLKGVSRLALGVQTRSTGSSNSPSAREPAASLDIDEAHTLLACCPEGSPARTALPTVQHNTHRAQNGGAAVALLARVVEALGTAQSAGSSRLAASTAVVKLITSALAARSIPTSYRAWPAQLQRIAAGSVRMLMIQPQNSTALPEGLLSSVHRSDLVLTLSCCQPGHAERLRKLFEGVLLERQPSSAGPGVLTTHGTTGKPPEGAAASSAAAAVVNAILGVGDLSSGMPTGADVDGLDSLALGVTLAGMRFSNDSRLRVVANMLRACRPSRLFVGRPVGASDHDFMTLQQLMLAFHSRRVCATAIGRGMVTCFSVQSTYVDPVHVPLVTVAVQVQPLDVLLRLDISGVNSTGFGITDWPEFNNGCAAALRLLPPYKVSGSVAAKSTSALRRLQRGWLRAHRFTGSPPDLATATAAGTAAAVGLPSAAQGALPSSGAASGLIPANPAHAGVYMALGITGELSGISPSDLLELLSMTHSCTTVGVLLGAAAGSRGSVDPTLVKAVVLHIPAIIPGASAELDIPPVVQSTCLVALGLLHEGTGSRAMADFLLKEISNFPLVSTDIVPPERPAYSACAGFGLGLVMLGLGPQQGREGGPAIEPKLTDRLLRLLVGGKDSKGIWAAKQVHTNAPGRPKLLHEQDKINTTLTVPGSVLALSLMYLRTGNARVRAALAPPDALGQLDHIRPDDMLLRCMGRVLVDWHEHDSDESDMYWDYTALTHEWRVRMGMRDTAVAPGPIMCRISWEHQRRARVRAWVTAQVPAAVRRVMRRLYVKHAGETGAGAALAKLAAWMALAGDDEDNEAPSSSSNPSHTNAPTPKPTAQVQYPDASAATAPPVDGPLEALDLEQIKTMYVMCLAGACLGLGMRYAGTGDPIVRDELVTQAYVIALLRDSSDKASFDPLLAEVNAMAARANAAALQAGQALYQELTVRDGLQPTAALAHVNSLLALPVDIAPEDDSLLSPWPEPLSGFPLTLAADGSGVAKTEPVQSNTQSPGLRTRSFTLSLASALCPPRCHIEQALVSGCAAPAIVMAGSLDLPVLRLLRSARQRLDAHTVYGTLMGLHMAIGLVSAAGGRVTLSRSNSSIASLVAAFFPYWPHGTATNSPWPQAIRNLWACAADARCLDTLELSASHSLGGSRTPGGVVAPGNASQSGFTGAAHMRPVRVGVEVVVKPVVGAGQLLARKLRCLTPCLLPDLHRIESIRILPSPATDVNSSDSSAEWEEYTLAVASNPSHARVLTCCLENRHGAVPFGAPAMGSDPRQGVSDVPVLAPMLGHTMLSPKTPSRRPPGDGPTAEAIDDVEAAGEPAWAFACVSPAQAAAVSSTSQPPGQGMAAAMSTLGSAISAAPYDADVSMTSMDVSLENILAELAPAAMKGTVGVGMGSGADARQGEEGFVPVRAHLEDPLLPFARRCNRSIVICVQKRTDE